MRLDRDTRKKAYLNRTILRERPNGRPLMLDTTLEVLATAHNIDGMSVCTMGPDEYVSAFQGSMEATPFISLGLYFKCNIMVKKGLEIAVKLKGENFIFWGGREGYQSLLNTNLRTELDHMAALLRMAADYKHKIGFTGQLCIEPKPKEPTKHQYDFDAMTVIGFLKTYGLDKEFKLNIEPNHTTLAGHDYVHDVSMASAFGMLGSIDANQGSADLGWDTDQFPSDIKSCTQLVKVVVDQGGIAPGGLNFDCKVRRESIDVVDMFIAHIGAMDTLGRALLNVRRINDEGVVDRLIKERYLSYKSTELGRAIESGKATLEDCEKHLLTNGEPTPISSKQEHFEAIYNRYL